MIPPGMSEKYLGTKTDPWVGTVKPDIVEQLGDWIQKIDNVPLKPDQKVTILNVFAIPRLIYVTDHTNCRVIILKSMDRAIRTAVKKWLHLPNSTCNGLLYSRCRDGGLGII